MEVLFICKANVGRSQMASAFFNKLSKKNYSISAGTHVNDREGQLIHEFVIDCMAELGYDLSKNTRKQLTPEMVQEADKIIVMTERENLPSYLRDSQKVAYWNIEDAKGMDYEFHCKTRDQIKGLVEKLVEDTG